MDLLTHAVLGASCAHLVLYRKDYKIPVIAGALAAIAPDADLFITLFSTNPLSVELWHRSFSHALAFIPIGGILVTLFLMLFPLFRKKWSITLAAALIGMATHGVLDACTSYGTQLLWPWSHQRSSWDIIAIIDPLFTIILSLGGAWSIIFHERKAAILSLILASMLLLFHCFQHQKAIHAAQLFAKKNQITLTRIRALPALGSATSWRIIAHKQQCVFIATAYTPLWGTASIAPVMEAAQCSWATHPHDFAGQQNQELDIFSWFSDNYLIVANQNPLIIADGRYTDYQGSRFISLWGIKINNAKNHVTKVKMIPLNISCENQ